MTKTAVETLELPPARKLNKHHDRCDRCQAQALVTAVRITDLENNLTYQELLFCGHHGRRHRPVLEAQGWIVEDYTHEINVKPSISANAE